MLVAMGMTDEELWYMRSYVYHALTGILEDFAGGALANGIYIGDQ